MALTLATTAAGRAALRNAAGDGSNAVRLALVGLTATAFTSGQPLPAEIKRLDTLAGGATAADTIHVTVTDAGTDVYSVRGFGFYLQDGTLFASYGQAGVIVEKSAQSLMQLALDVQFVDVAAGTITVGDTNFSNPAATIERLGVVQLATDDETSAGKDSQHAVTPRSFRAALDARFGSGAPTDLARKLLGLATAAAMRLMLEIKGAALKDEGNGNGLDADLLDGQHGAAYLEWKNFTGVPATFPPSTHRTDWSTIDNVPAMATRWTAWADLTDKPLTFAPMAHSHVWTDINNPPATATRWPAVAEVTGLPDALAGKAATTSPTLGGRIGWTQYNTVLAATFNPGGFGAGNGDGADFKTANMAVHSWNGIGFGPSITGQAVPLGEYSHVFNTRTGEMSCRGRITTWSHLRLAANGGEGQISWGVDDWYNYSNAETWGLASPSKGAGLQFRKSDKALTSFGDINVAGDDNFGLHKNPSDDTLTLKAWKDLRFQRRVDNLTYAVWHGGNFNPAGKQDTLGFVPVQQGGGIGQATNKIFLGWGGNKVKITVDATDMGNVALESWVGSTYVPLSGAMLQGELTSLLVADGTSIANYGRGTFRAQSNSATAAAISFVRQGAFGAYLGIDTDNRFKVGGWSMGNVAYALFHEGNFNPGSKADVGHRHSIGDTGGLLEWLNDRPTRGEFSLGDGENAVMRLPNGIMVQFGAFRVSVPWQEGTGPTIAFPTQFPGGCQMVLVSDLNTNPGNRGWGHYDASAQITGWTAANFATYIQWPGSSDANNWSGCTFIAIGRY